MMAKNSLKQLAIFLGRKLILVSLTSFIIGILIFVIELIFAWSIQNFFNLLGVANSTKSSQSYLDWIPHNSLENIVILFIFVAIFRALLFFAQMYFAGISTIEFETLNRKRIADWAFNERTTSLAEVTTLFNDITVGAGSFYSSIIGIFSRILILILLLVTLFKFSYLGTLLILFLVGTITIPFIIISKKIKFFSSTLHIELDSAIKRIISGVKNSLFLHTYGLNEKEKASTKAHLSSYLYKYEKYYFYSSVKSLIPQIVGIIILSAMMVGSKKFNLLPDTLLIQYFYLFTRFVQFIGESANLASYVNLTKPRFLLMWDWWLVAKDKLKSTKFEIQDPFTEPVGIRISKLRFGYESEKVVFNNFQINIIPGSVFLITGPSGVGKSTLLSLMLGMLNPDSGEILLYTSKNFSGESLAKIRGKLFSSIGYVGADSYIIRGTIKENLLYGNELTVSDEEISEAISHSGCNFIYKLPGGMNHFITEQGEGLSAGQKQRLALARALIRKPKILILDEATANLDLKTEKRIIDTLSSFKGTMTIVVVTHRDSMLEIADQHLNLTRSGYEII